MNETNTNAVLYLFVVLLWDPVRDLGKYDFPFGIEYYV